MATYVIGDIYNGNPDIHLWLTEGMALYLSNGEEFYKEYLEEMKISTYEDTCKRNFIRFSNCGGYTFVNTYIEYLKSSKEICDEWILYLNNYYQ